MSDVEGWKPAVVGDPDTVSWESPCRHVNVLNCLPGGNHNRDAAVGSAAALHVSGLQKKKKKKQKKCVQY